MWSDRFWNFWAKSWPEKITSHDGCFLLTLQNSAITFLLLEFSVQTTRVPANFSNPRKSTRFFRWKGHLLYILVVPDSLTESLCKPIPERERKFVEFQSHIQWLSRSDAAASEEIRNAKIARFFLSFSVELNRGFPNQGLPSFLFGQGPDCVA